MGGAQYQLARLFTSITFFVNIFLHALLAAAFSILVAFAIHKRPIGKLSDGLIPELLSLKFIVLPSLVLKVYGAALLYFTQDLALHRESLVPQRLTNIHDKTMAWLGEGKAAGALAKQTSFKGNTLWRVGCTLLCLVLLAVINASAASLLTYAWVAGDPTYLPLTQYLTVGTVANVTEAYPILSILPVMDIWELATVTGVWNNVVFDSVLFQETTVPNVAAVQFIVNRQTLPNAYQSGPIKVNQSTSTITYPFHVDGTLQDAEFSLANQMLNIVSVNPKNSDSPSSPILVVASTIEIDDSQGRAQSRSQLDPPLATPGCAMPNCFQVLACNIMLTDRRIAVDASQGVPENGNDLLVLNDTWTEWDRLPTPGGLLEMTLGAFAGNSPSSNVQYNVALLNNSATGSLKLSLLEDAVMDDLTVADIVDPYSSIYLYDLNLSLGTALELVLLSVTNDLNATATPLPQNLQAQSSSSGSQKPPRDGYQFRGLCQIGSTMPFVALGSLLLLIHAIILTWPAPDSKTTNLEIPKGVGVLQIFWRAGKIRSRVPRIPAAAGQAGFTLAAEELVKRTQTPDMPSLRVIGMDIEVLVDEAKDGPTDSVPSLLINKEA
ncbi:hypothetical protein BC835DRAFT_1415520 [Cytidiella melzeri]|nr:hypothetical protein BC835DRAFT_1415520 [Cytidiella melzeri]